MKLTKYFLPLAGIAMMASCSNDKIMDPVPSQPDAQGKEMVANFRINLPTAKGTRAIGANDFDEGTEKENAINNAQFFIFKKDQAQNEDGYTYVTQSSIFYPGSIEGNNEVAKKATVYIQLSEVDLDDDLYGLCVVNIPEDFPIPTDGNTTFGKYKKELASYNDFVHNGGFTMTNAPTWGWDAEEEEFSDDDPSIKETLQTLVKLNNDAFAVSPNLPTESAGTFYVQRGVAKVVVLSDDSNNELESTVSDVHLFIANNWGLDVTNTVAYPVQNVSLLTGDLGEWKADLNARNQTAKSVPSDHFFTTNASRVEFNHIWWGDDPNYDKNTISSYSNGFNFITADWYPEKSGEEEGEDANLDNPITLKLAPYNYSESEDLKGNDYAYCLENTMKFDCMNQDQTTRVIIKGKYSIDDGKTYVSFVVSKKNDQVCALVDKEGNTFELQDVTLSKEGTCTLKDLFFGPNYEIPEDKSGEEGDIDNADYEAYLKTKANMEAVAEVLQQNPDGSEEVYFYEGGETYYVARIKHFSPIEGDDETYWKAEDSFTSSSTASVIYTPKHTGRYGVLRNNLYEIKLGRVLGYGSPVLPPPPGNTPDDEIDDPRYNMEVYVNVLKWARRQYEYDLK